MFDEESYGIIPLRKQDSKWQVFIILLKSGNHWGFPKGHQEENESSKESAQRELKEETNLEVDHYLIDKPLIEKYHCVKNERKIYKRVTYYIASVKGQECLQSKEILEGKWLDLDQAYEQITYPESKKVCKELQTILNNTQ